MSDYTTEDGKRTTTDGKAPRPGFEQGKAGAPAPVNPATGQHEAYWVLSKEERARGFVRPLRRTYVHTGNRPKYPTRPLTDDEKRRFEADKYGYILYEPYPDPGSGSAGRLWTKEQLKSGCGAQTSMSASIAETYARDPKFYGSTFCVTCGAHYPVREFTWADDGRTVGS